MSEADQKAMPDTIYAWESEHGAGAWIADAEDVVSSAITHAYVPKSTLDALTAENDRLKARVAELEGALWGCIDEMMSLAHDSFDGVWNEQDFLAIEKPFRTALKNKDASDDI